MEKIHHTGGQISTHYWWQIFDVPNNLWMLSAYTTVFNEWVSLRVFATKHPSMNGFHWMFAWYKWRGEFIHHLPRSLRLFHQVPIVLEMCLLIWESALQEIDEPPWLAPTAFTLSLLILSRFIPNNNSPFLGLKSFSAPESCLFLILLFFLVQIQCCHLPQLIQ